jgi:hypothetical protein
MVTRPTASFSEPEQESPAWLRAGLASKFERSDIGATDLERRRAQGFPLHLMEPDRSDQDNASIRIGPSMTRRILRAIAGLVFLVLVGIGGMMAWQSFGGELAMVKAWAPSLAEMLSSSTTKPAAPAVGAEIQQQLKSIAADLAALRYTVEQLTANQDPLMHTQEQISRAQEQMSRAQEQISRTQEQMAQSIATLQTGEQLVHKRSSPPPAKPVHVLPPAKPVQHPAQLTSPAPSKAADLPPPESLQPQDNE